MPTNPPSAAAALYRHLPKAEPVERPTNKQSSLAAAMYPSLKPKPPNPQRNSLLRGLRKLNRTIDERLARERKR